MLTINCIHCGQRFGVAEHLHGKKVACTTCGGRISIPRLIDSSDDVDETGIRLKPLVDRPPPSRLLATEFEPAKKGNVIVVVACLVGALAIACLVLGIAATFAWNTITDLAEGGSSTSGQLANTGSDPSESVNATSEPPTVPDRFVFRPTFMTNRGTAEAGTAFIVMLPDKNVPIALTAIHLLGPAGGLDRDVPGAEVPEVTQRVILEECFNSEIQLDIGSMALSIPPAAPLNSPSLAGDIAAFWITGSAKVTALPIAERDPVKGERIWLAGPVIGGAPRTRRLHAARVHSFEEGNLYFQYDNPAIELRATSGAPVLNANGQVVAINLGGGQMNGNVIGVGNPVSRFRPHLVQAAANPPAVPAEQATIAATPPVVTGEITEDPTLAKRKAIYVAAKTNEMRYKRGLATRERLEQSMLDRMRSSGSNQAMEGMRRMHDSAKKHLAESYEQGIDSLCSRYDITRKELDKILAEGDAAVWNVPGGGALMERIPGRPTIAR